MINYWTTQFKIETTRPGRQCIVKPSRVLLKHFYGWGFLAGFSRTASSLTGTGRYTLQLKEAWHAVRGYLLPIPCVANVLAYIFLQFPVTTLMDPVLFGQMFIWVTVSSPKYCFYILSNPKSAFFVDLLILESGVLAKWPKFIQMPTSVLFFVLYAKLVYYLMTYCFYNKRIWFLWDTSLLNLWLLGC